MKVRLTLIVFSLISISALTLSARTTSGDDNLETAAIAAPASGMESREVSNVLGVPSGVPRGPSELLHDYEAEMSAITQRFGDEVAAIANAVHSGQLTSDQGQQITAEQYQLAQMQFEVLSAWHDMLAQDLSRTNQGTEDREEGTERKRSPRTVQQELDHLTKDLELTPTQQKNIKPLLEEHHEKIQALREQNPTLSWQDLAPQIHAISAQTHHEIEALLTKRQKQLANAMQKRMPEDYARGN